MWVHSLARALISGVVSNWLLVLLRDFRTASDNNLMVDASSDLDVNVGSRRR